MHGQLDVVHIFVATSQHWFARQSACVWQHAMHAPLVQHSAELPQSESTQHAAVVHAPLQHFWPVAHWASDVHWQFAEAHWFVAVLQHWSARQSALVWQHVAQDPFVQHSAEPPQSESTQQVAVVHPPLQHFCPFPHCASFVHWQFAEPHCFVTGPQHWLARQSACVWQHAVHAPFVQHSVELPQSQSVQQLAVVHAPLIDIWRFGALRRASDVHLQLFACAYVCVAVSQHWSARQSPLVQQAPATHCRRSFFSRPLALPASPCSVAGREARRHPDREPLSRQYGCYPTTKPEPPWPHRSKVAPSQGREQWADGFA